ncbi:MAG: PAS domain S-box protein [Desulfobacterales bacterium]|nr:PAS domain S-box protein [Desulfobacterales bacterium]
MKNSSKPSNILILHDHPEDIETLTSILKPTYTILRKNDIFQPSGELRDSISIIDLILLNPCIPNNNGFDTCKQLQSRHIKRIPVMLILQNQDDLVTIDVTQLCRWDCIIKPFHKEILLIRIQTHIHLSKLEYSLQESETQYHSLLDNIQEGYYEVDRAGNLVFFNRSLSKMLGYSPEEMVGMNNRRYTDKENAAKLYRTYKKIYETEQPVIGFEWEVMTKQGDRRFAAASASLIKNSEGKQIGIRGIVRDVTEKKRTEAELINARNFLQNIFNSSIDGICTTDLRGTIQFASPSAESILGYTPAELNGMKIYSLYSNAKDDAKMIMQILTTKGKFRDFEMKLLRKDGHLIDFNLSAALLKDENGVVIGTLGIFRDITEKKRLEEQIRQTAKMKAISIFAGGTAHNFNNLLMAIQGYTSLMLLDCPADHRNHHLLKQIERHIQQGAKLTRRLIEYAGYVKFSMNRFDLHLIIKRSCELFFESNPTIHILQKLSANQFYTHGDAEQLKEVLLNIFTNAAEAMNFQGELFISTSTVEQHVLVGKIDHMKAATYICISIQDIGKGMRPEIISSIFDPFFSTKEAHKGAGLGLASAYGIIMMHNGHIEASSEPGKGATFQIFLPACD